MGKKYRYLSYLLCVVLSLGVLILPIQSSFAQSASPFGYPLKNQIVSEGFSLNGGLYSAGHSGVDFSAKPGTPVYAIADGQVIFAGLVSGKLYITIDHGGDIKSTYSIMATKTVSKGDQVVKGKLIGTASGQTVAGSANSFMLTIRKGNSYVDPMSYIKGDVTPRKISLGAIKHNNKSWLDDASTSEQKSLAKFISQINPVVDVEKNMKQIEDFVNWFNDTGSKTLEESLKKVGDTYKETKEVLDEFKEVAKQVLQDKKDGFKDKVKKGLKKLKAIEKKVIKKLKSFIKVAKKFKDLYMSMVKKALKLGIDVVKWVHDNMTGFLKYYEGMLANIIMFVYDSAITQANTTLKVLDSYFDVDWNMLFRELFIPTSCMTGGCVVPVKMACDIGAKLKVRSSDTFKGSGNGVMLVSGLNSNGIPELSADDEGVGQRVDDQTTNLPWKTLGYSRDDVSYYGYDGAGKAFDHTKPNQDLNISTKHMDDQIRQWKIDNPGKKLDLIGHSLGGSIIGLWLANYYDKTDLAYPELGKVIMYAPPLNGTALASGGEIVDSSTIGTNIHDIANKIIPGDQFPSDAVSTKQVAEGGLVAQQLAESKVLQEVDVYTIRSSDDLIVTAGTRTIDGMHEIVYDSAHSDKEKIPTSKEEIAIALVKMGIKAGTSHSDLTTDEWATAISQSILEDKKPPCIPVTNALVSVGKSAVVRSGELLLGRTIDNTSRNLYGQLLKPLTR